jgi:hypothetical protein
VIPRVNASELNSSDIVQARQRIRAGERPILRLIPRRLEIVDEITNLQARIAAVTALQIIKHPCNCQLNVIVKQS